ncbi:hypothetical protein Aargi30884_27840 [Amedibacterium intestinale]|jgi:hypothetical protein|uniref:Uncharacterized protein n=1 Tax=Amedibacterium intestinale TaxID=2583452 RepID=A0A6N4TMV2_9FIRM|nr:hypothetical protein [Amedibacterium intestinale]BBK23881.1 hypothetical protein Aargi30884_27840 [Amedibacterium intestinale]DAQ11603.1 MAG TPA: hypothetical protein [Caudoviricetes sp.]
MKRKEELVGIFKDVDENTLNLILPLIDEVVFIEEMMRELKKLPFIRVHPKNPSKQETTPAGKQYKEFSQSYMNAIRILCSILNKVDSNAENELLKKLADFE